MSERVFLIGEKFTEISGHARDDFINTLVDLKEGDEEVITLDFTGVESLSSLGLAAIGKLHTQLEDQARHLKVKGLNENLYRIFDITGLVKMLDVEDPETSEQNGK